MSIPQAPRSTPAARPGDNGHNPESSHLDVPPAGRMLLLPHCLRPSEGCTGKITDRGLICAEGCQNPCQIRPLREAAERAGYGTICVAPGGRLAVRSVERARPPLIISVA